MLDVSRCLIGTAPINCFEKYLSDSTEIYPIDLKWATHSRTWAMVCCARGWVCVCVCVRACVLRVTIVEQQSPHIRGRDMTKNPHKILGSRNLKFVHLSEWIWWSKNMSFFFCSLILSNGMPENLLVEERVYSWLINILNAIVSVIFLARFVCLHSCVDNIGRWVQFIVLLAPGDDIPRYATGRPCLSDENTTLHLWKAQWTYNTNITELKVFSISVLHKSKLN